MITVAVVVDEFMFWVVVVDFVVIVQQSIIIGPVILVQVWFPVRFRLEPEYFHFVGIHDGRRDIFVKKKPTRLQPRPSVVVGLRKRRVRENGPKKNLFGRK